MLVGQPITGTFDMDFNPAKAQAKGFERDLVHLKDVIEHMGQIKGPNAIAKAFELENKRLEDLAAKAAAEAGKPGFLDSLKNGLGEQSGFGKSMKLLAGGGAIAGIGLASHAIGQLGGAALEMAEAFQKGDAAWGRMVGKLQEKIPIIGSAIKGIGDFNEALFKLSSAPDTSPDPNVKLTADRVQALKEFNGANELLRIADQAKRDRQVLEAPNEEAAGLLERQNATMEQRADLTRKYNQMLVDQKIDLLSIDKLQDELNSTNVPLEKAVLQDNINASKNAAKKLEDAYTLAYAAIDQRGDASIAKFQKEQQDKQADAAKKLFEQNVAGAAQWLRQGAAAVASLFKASDREKIELPNPGIQAQEIFGRRTVTQADVPQPMIEIQKDTKRTADNTEKMVDGLKNFGKSLLPAFQVLTGI